MKKHFGTSIVVFIMLALLGSHCTKTTTTEKEPPKPILDPVKPTQEVRKPGTFCFYTKESNLSIEGRMDLDANNTVVGNLKGNIVDENNGMTDSYDSSFNGRLVGDSLHVSVLSNETGTKKETQEIWVWKGDDLQQGKHLLKSNTCPN